MSTASSSVPQPLNGVEIRRGIAVRMTGDLPDGAREEARERISSRLEKVCTLVPNAAYARFKATWTLTWWLREERVGSNWRVEGTLDDYGRQIPFSMEEKDGLEDADSVTLSGTIDFTPPDKFRRDTDQPVPKPIELKKSEDAGMFSRSNRGQGKRRTV